MLQFESFSKIIVDFDFRGIMAFFEHHYQLSVQKSKLESSLFHRGTQWMYLNLEIKSVIKVKRSFRCNFEAPSLKIFSRKMNYLELYLCYEPNFTPFEFCGSHYFG